MQVLLLLTAILAISSSVLIITRIIKSFKNQCSKSRDFPMLIISITYTIFAILLLLWFFNILTYEVMDLVVVYSVVITIKAVALVFTLFKNQGNKKILYSFFLYPIVLLLIVLNPLSIHFLIPVSFLIITLSYLIFSHEHKPHITTLIVYSAISLIFYIISIITIKPILLLLFISTLVFTIFIKILLKDFQTIPEAHPLSLEPKETPVLSFLRHFVFIIIITNFLFMGTVAVHEMGHLATAKFLGCENTKIVYEVGFLPHTEIDCKDTSGIYIWALGGILVPIIIGILLMFGGGKFIKEIALEIIGFGLIISYLDAKSLGLSETLSIFIMISGITLFVLSLALLTKSRTEN